MFIKIKLKIKIKIMGVGPILTTFYLENGKTYKTSISILNKENCIWKAKRNKSSKDGWKINARHTKKIEIQFLAP